MRACVVHPPRPGTPLAHSFGQAVGFSIVDIPEVHRKLGPNEVLVRVTAFSLNYRDRSWIRNRASRPKLAHRDRAIGSEFAGIVEAVGPETSLTVGDRVMADMAWPSNGVRGVLGGVPTNAASVEQQIFHEAKLTLVPQTMDSTRAAAFVLGASTAEAMVRRVGVRPGDQVLVTGARSNTSLFVAQILAAEGAHPIGLTRSADTRERLLSAGFDEVYSADQLRDPNSDLVELSNSINGFRAAIDPFSDVYLALVDRMLRIGGRYVTCGVADQQLDRMPAARDFPLDMVLNLMIAKNLRIHGNCLGLPGDLTRAVEHFEAGRLAPVLDSVHSSDDLESFVARTFAQDRFGKVVCVYSNSGGDGL